MPTNNNTVKLQKLTTLRYPNLMIMLVSMQHFCAVKHAACGLTGVALNMNFSLCGQCLTVMPTREELNNTLLCCPASLNICAILNFQQTVLGVRNTPVCTVLKMTP